MGSEYDVLRRVSGMEDGPLLDALDAALNARILEEQGESFTFRHPLLRETLYAHLSRARRTHLHLRLAEALIELRPEAIESIAYHYDRAHAPEAVEWLERAGDRAASIYATDSALALYEDAGSRLAAEDAEGHMRLQEKLGDVLLVAGRYDDAIAVLERAEQRARAQDDLETAGRVTAALGLAHRWRGTPEDGIARVQTMVDRLSPRGPSPAMAALYLSLAHLHFLVGRYHEMLEAARRAGEIATAVGEPAMAAEAQERYGAGLLLVDRAEEGKRVLEAALPTVETTGNRDLLRRTLVNAGCAAAYVGELETQVRYFERALKVAEEIGNVGQIAFVLGNLGSALILLGDWSSARRHIERAVSLAREGARDANLAAPLLMLGQLASKTGEWPHARAVLQDALAVAEATTNRQTREQIHVHLAELDLMEGRTEDAIARLEPLASADDVDTMVLSLLSQALLEAGDLERADIVVSRVVRRGREGELFVLPEALAEEGRLRALQGRVDDAERSFAEALDVARLRGLPYVEARTLYWMGLLDLERGAHRSAAGRLEEALAIFCRLGACPDAQRTEAALQAVSGAPRR
jgi:tetratricopeptide (TPR) repeat protein